MAEERRSVRRNRKPKPIRVVGARYGRDDMEFWDKVIVKWRYDLLKPLREQRGWSLGQLARLLDARFKIRVDRSTVYRWEVGERMPRLEEILALCCIYGVNLIEVEHWK